MNEMMNYEMEMNDTELEDVNGGGFLTAIAVGAAAIAIGYGTGWVAGKIFTNKTGVCHQ